MVGSFIAKTGKLIFRQVHTLQKATKLRSQPEGKRGMHTGHNRTDPTAHHLHLQMQPGFQFDKPQQSTSADALIARWWVEDS